MKAIRLAVFSIFMLTAAALFLIHKDVHKKNRYITSEKCAGCHRALYDAWSATPHPKIFRPVRSDKDLLGDFNSMEAAYRFKKKDVQYVVGSRWEQVYVKKVGGEYYQLPAKWFINKKMWVPVPDAKDVPMSMKCNGCHSTGFNPETLEFSEFGIGCEACHGPGKLHADGRRKRTSPLCSICHRFGSAVYSGDIVVSVNSAVCGQCHNRGANVQQAGSEGGKFSFPAGYAPGDDIKKYFKEMDTGSDKKNEFWWGNGISKNRHQEFMDWQKSKHSRSLQLMEEKYTDARGKKNEGCLRCHSTDYRMSKPGSRPGLDTARYGITCVACHDPHGLDRQFPNIFDVSQRCGGCHIDSMSLKTYGKGRPHYPCPPGKVLCADCHMPLTVASGGEFSLRSHAFRIIEPGDTVKYGVPNSCQNGNCHKDKDTVWASNEFRRFYSSAGTGGAKAGNRP